MIIYKEYYKMVNNIILEHIKKIKFHQRFYNKIFNDY